MNSGIQAAASGMRAQVEALDILANNLANLNTIGFKEQKAFFTYLSDAAASSQSAEDDPSGIHAVSAQAALNVTDGNLQSTGRDFDIALMGEGYMAVQTPQGVRYTRNGSLQLNEKSELITSGGYPILDDNGQHITVGPGRLNITEKGLVDVDNKKIGKLKLVTFDTPALVIREGNSLVAPPANKPTPKPADIQVKQGFLEQSNVNTVASVVEMVGIMRRFEAISKSVNLMFNDLDTKAIEKLSR